MIYPKVKDPSMVGEYPAVANVGGGYVWDEVLEYRVWCADMSNKRLQNVDFGLDSQQVVRC